MFVKDKDGKQVWQNQQVHLGRTESGQHGYFTGRMLAFPLTPEEYVVPTEQHVARCKRMNFEFEGSTQ